jgi:predicted transcriptional regulator
MKAFVLSSQYKIILRRDSMVNENNFNRYMKNYSTTINNYDLIKMIKDLTGTEFKLLLFLLATKNNLISPLKRNDILKLTNLSKSSYYRAMENLKEKGLIE